MSEDPGPGTGTGSSELSAAERRAAAEQGKQREPRFTVAELLERPGIVERSAAEVAAAYHDADPEQELTRAQAEKTIEHALEREVEADVEEGALVLDAPDQAEEG